MERRRLSLGDAVRVAVRGAADTPGGIDEPLVSLPAALAIGLWWWVRGVPVKRIPPTHIGDDDAEGGSGEER